MLTTLGETQNKIAGLEAGADDYIQKPKSPDEVQEMFARIRAQLRTADLASSWPSATACWNRPTRSSRSSSSWHGRFSSP